MQSAAIRRTPCLFPSLSIRTRAVDGVLASVAGGERVALHAERSGATRLIVLGDFLHAKAGRVVARKQ